MDLQVGTSGYSYKEWKGPFYPEDLAPSEMLSFYAERLPSVEINNTFYRLPKVSVLENWAAQVPESFRFSIKASRRITHVKRLKGAEDETAYLLRTVESLGDRLGVLLFQLPPNLKLDLPRLDTFLNLIPRGVPAAFEFRNPSWMVEGVYERLRKRDMAIVTSDTDDSDAPELIPTAGFGYLRLRRSSYVRADLAAWAKRIQSQAWNRAFVFFKHEDEGAGPKLASRFLELAQRSSERKQPQAAAKPKTRRKAG